MTRVQEWCPNCAHFFKETGLNNCKLVDWSINPLGGNRAVLAWLETYTDEGTRIDPNADHCPGFVPYEKLAQRLYSERRG